MVVGCVIKHEHELAITVERFKRREEAVLEPFEEHCSIHVLVVVASGLLGLEDHFSRQHFAALPLVWF